MTLRELLEACAFITDIELAIFKDNYRYDEWHIGPREGYITPYSNAWDEHDRMHTYESRCGFNIGQDDNWRHPHYIPDEINYRHDKDYWGVMISKVPAEILELKIDDFDLWSAGYSDRECLRGHAHKLVASVYVGKDYRSKPDKIQKAAAKENDGQISIDELLEEENA